MAKYLVTGGAGFIGSNLVSRLINEKHNVIVLDNYSAGYKIERIHPEATYVVGDIRDHNVLNKVCKGVDGIFHLAANPSVQFSIESIEESHDINVTGTMGVLSAAKKSGVKRVVFSSSCAVYGDQDIRRPLKEDDIKIPLSPYGSQKRMGTEYCHFFSTYQGIDTCSLAYFNVYGPFMDPQGAYAAVIGKFFAQWQQDTPLTVCGDGLYIRDFVHVTDVINANIAAMEYSQPLGGEIFNIGTGKPVTVLDLATIISDKITYVAERPGDILYSCANVTKVQKMLGWSAQITLEEGIAMLKKDNTTSYV